MPPDSHRAMIVRPPDPDVYKHRKHIRAAGGCHKTVANRRFSPKKPGQRMSSIIARASLRHVVLTLFDHA